jgi:hypothetical protein
MVRRSEWQPSDDLSSFNFNVWPVPAKGLIYAKPREGTAGAATTARTADAGQLLSRTLKGQAN